MATNRNRTTNHVSQAVWPRRTGGAFYVTAPMWRLYADGSIKVTQAC
ncbi:MAG TPA: hypothetical protein VM597_17860 [Gemmataceae bacterium]|nr:hypothetical protein [Gemmataceae bacterium]